MLKRTLYAALLMAGAFGAQSAGATTWDFSGSTTGTTNGNTISRGTGTGMATASAFANTGGTDTSGSTATSTQNQTIETAIVSAYTGGLGVKNRDACTTACTNKDLNEGIDPEHSIDNNQRYDSVLLSFAQSTKLTSLQIGWKSTTTGADTDLSVLAFTGTIASGKTINNYLLGKTYGQLLTSGWSVIGNYADLTTSSARNVNQASSASTDDEVNINVSSSYWLVGAYNPLVRTSTGSAFTFGNDYFKLKYVTGTPSSSTPEPGSLVLAGVALAGMMGVRRRKAA